MTTAELTASITFTKLVVNDLDASQAFYEAVFGVSKGLEIKSEIGGRPIRELIYRRADGSTGLILLAFEDGTPQGKGDVMLGAWSNDVQALCDRIVANGGSIIDPPHVSDAVGTPMLVAIAADNEGHMLELVQST